MADATPVQGAPKKAAPQSKAERWKTVHERAMKRWKLVSEAESDQREQELEDLKFARALPRDHWPEGIFEERTEGGTGMDGATTPQRPTLVIDKLDQPITSIVNEARKSRLAILIKPKGEGANQETAEVLQGLIRAIEVDSNAPAARIWAYDRAVKCGRGYYHLDVGYANDGDLDLDILYKMIPNQGCVYLDPFAAEPDRSDMKWAFLTGDYDKTEYPEKFGDEGVLALTGDELSSVNDKAPGWVTEDAVRVANYYEVETAPAMLVQIGGRKFIVDPPKGYRLPTDVQPLPPELLGVQPNDAREVQLRRVVLYVLNGHEILSETPWNGRYIPIIPVFGKIYNVDGEMSYQGIVTKSKDAGRLYDATVSSAVEAAMTQTKAPYIAAAGQVERHKAMWDDSNTRNYAVLLYDPLEINGTLLPPPQRTQQEPALMGHAMLLQQADGDIKATTGRWEASLGQLNPSDRSGKAIQKLQQQAELGSSNYIDQFASISMFYEGKVLLDLIPVVYDRPGRVVRILGEEEGDERSVMLNAPFQETPQGPQPAPEQPGIMQRAVGAVRGMMGGPPPPKTQKYDLSRGRFAVVPSVGPSSQTQREENLNVLMSILETSPDVAPNILDLVAENMDGPMPKKLAQRLRAMNPNIPKDENSDIPPEAQAIITQLEQQAQEMQQQMAEMQQALATDQAKQQASIEIAKLESGVKERIEIAKAQAVIAKTRAEIQGEAERAQFDAQMAQTLAEFDAAIKLSLQNDQQAHERMMQRMKADDAREMASRTEAATARGDVRKAALTPQKSGGQKA